jgi:hypothetical protein
MSGLLREKNSEMGRGERESAQVEAALALSLLFYFGYFFPFSFLPFFQI